MAGERMPLRTVVSTNESNFCSDENGIEEISVPLHGIQESKVNLKYLAQVQEMESLCRSKDRKIDALSASYADSLQEICRLKSQLESITLSNGDTKDSDRKETEGAGKKKKSLHHQEDEQSQLQELHQKIEEDLNAKKQELKKLLECIQRKETVAQVKRGELIKVMHLKNISLLHLEDEITRAKKTRSLLQEQLAQGELKLKSQQQQIEHQERLISMQHDGQSVNGEGELLETKVSRPLPESKECDVKDDGHGQVINERAIKLCSSFSSSYSDMTARIRVLAQQLRKLQRLLDVSLIEKEQVTSHFARIREKCRKQAKIIYDLKGERDQLLSRRSKSGKSTRAPLKSKSSSDSTHEATIASDQSLVDLTQLEKKHAEIIQKNNWNKELKDFMREVIEYARKKEEEVHQIKQVTQAAQAVKEYSTCRSDSIKMSSLSECSELTTSELVDELHLKERTILNLMEQLKLCQEKYSHVMEENQKITLKMECHQTCEDSLQKKIMELEMKPSHLAQPESDVAAEKDSLLSRHEKLMMDHELTETKIEDLTQKLAVSEKDKTIMEGILQELSKELVCVEQDKAEMQSALEDLRRRQEEYSCEEPLITNGALKKAVMFPDSCESVLSDVCNSMTTNRIPHAKKVSEEGLLHRSSIKYQHDRLTPPTTEVYIPGVHDVLTVNSNNSSSVGVVPATITPEPKSCVSGTPAKNREAKFKAPSVAGLSSRCRWFLPNLLVCLLVILLFLLILLNISAPSHFLFDIFESYFEHTKINNIY